MLSQTVNLPKTVNLLNGLPTLVQDDYGLEALFYNAFWSSTDTYRAMLLMASLNLLPIML